VDTQRRAADVATLHAQVDRLNAAIGEAQARAAERDRALVDARSRTPIEITLEPNINELVAIPTTP